jgi:hypothetical protein
LEKPLGLPAGSVRAIITILLVITSAALLFVDTASGADDVKAMFVMLTGYAVKLYFDTRQDQETAAGPSVEDPELG